MASVKVQVLARATPYPYTRRGGWLQAGRALLHLEPLRIDLGIDLHLLHRQRHMADAVLLVLAMRDHQSVDRAEIRIIGPALLGSRRVERVVDAGDLEAGGGIEIPRLLESVLPRHLELQGGLAVDLVLAEKLHLVALGGGVHERACERGSPPDERGLRLREHRRLLDAEERLDPPSHRAVMDVEELLPEGRLLET